MDSSVEASDPSFGGKPTTSMKGAGKGGKKNNDTLATVSGTGTVHIMQDEFGNTFHGIETADGTRYEVVNFPTGIFSEGQSVNFTAYILAGYAMVNGYGQPIMLSAISAA
jgi:hypothetical protein